LLPLLPGSAAACTACFGKTSDQSLLDGIWWGIILLLTVTMSLVGGIGWFLYKTEKKGARG
jgi:hypothetical protein